MHDTIDSKFLVSRCHTGQNRSRSIYQNLLSHEHPAYIEASTYGKDLIQGQIEKFIFSKSLTIYLIG